MTTPCWRCFTVGRLAQTPVKYIFSGSLETFDYERIFIKIWKRIVQAKRKFWISYSDCFSIFTYGPLAQLVGPRTTLPQTEPTLRVLK